MLTSGEFVDVYVSLLEAEWETGSQEEFEAHRDQILEQHETSRDELVRFVEAHADDPEFLAALWHSIETRLQELGEERENRLQSEETLEEGAERELPLRRQQ